MKYILSSRGIDSDVYAAYLATVRDRLPPAAARFASDPRHFSLSDPESLHDAWLEAVSFLELPADGPGQPRRAAAEIRLLGAFHDRVHVLRYVDVRRYEAQGAVVGRGHGDLYTHEVRLGAGDSIEHELLFRQRIDDVESRILIECGDFTCDMIPTDRPAG